MLMTIYECKLIYVYIFSLRFFIIEIVCVLLDFSRKNLYIGVFFEYVANACGSWF